MSTYAHLIDATDFGIIASYLRNERSPIQFLLHVKTAAMLPKLAEELERKLAGPNFTVEDFSRMMRPLLEDGTLRILSRRPLSFPNPGWSVDPNGVPRPARCRVIYLAALLLCAYPRAVLRDIGLGNTRNETGNDCQGSEALGRSMSKTC